MDRKTQGQRTSRASLACAISLALALAAFPASAALAVDTPHIVAASDTDSCAACHYSHHDSSALASGLGVVGDDQSVVCLRCHSTDGTATANIVTGSRDSFGLASGHSLVTAATGSVQMKGCSACHDDHASSAQRPMIPSKHINGIAVTTSGPAVCLACHDTGNSWFGPGYPSTSAPTRDAAGYPVSGTWPGPDTYASSTNAHRLIPETTQTISASRKVKRQRGDCLYCHAAHRGANAYDSLLTTFTVPVASTLASDQADGSYAALCFECHGEVKPSGFATSSVDIKRFATASGGYGGHSIVTSGGTLPVGSPLPCFECHNPHGSKRRNASLISDERGGSLETSTAAGVRQFCFTCHTTNDTSAGWDSAGLKYVAISASSLVVGLPRDGGELRLRPNYGHNEVDTDSCYGCHGNSYAAGGHNVHDPLPTGQLTFAVLQTFRAVRTADDVPPVTIADLALADSGMVSLIATDTDSGIAETLYSVDGGVLSTGTVVAVAGDGTHTLQFWSVDNASNVETPTMVAFLVDETAPVTVSDAVADYAASATITLLSHDNNGGSGVADTYYRLDDEDIATGTVVTTSTVGPHTLDFWAVDVAGNVEGTQTVRFTIGDPPPIVSPPRSDVPSVAPSVFVAPLGGARLPDLVSREGPGLAGLVPPLQASG